jgi:hypothetical protein
MPPWQKLSLAQFLLRKLLGETGSKRFNILVILGKKSWLLLLLTNCIPKKQTSLFSKQREDHRRCHYQSLDTDLLKHSTLVPVTALKMDFFILHLKETASTCDRCLSGNAAMK